MTILIAALIYAAGAAMGGLAYHLWMSERRCKELAEALTTGVCLALEQTGERPTAEKVIEIMDIPQGIKAGLIFEHMADGALFCRWEAIDE